MNIIIIDFLNEIETVNVNFVSEVLISNQSSQDGTPLNSFPPFTHGRGNLTINRTLILGI